MAGVGDESLGTFFAQFVTKWSDDVAYDLKYFQEHYKLKENVSQYYLRKMTYAGTLCCVKVRNKTYYMKPKWKEHFKIFETHLDYVKVIE